MAFVDLGSLNFNNAVEATRAFPVTSVPVGTTRLQAALARGSLDPAIVLAWSIEVSQNGGTTWLPWGAAGTVGGTVLNKDGTVVTESTFELFLDAPATAQTRMRGSLTNTGARLTTTITIRGDTTPIPQGPAFPEHHSVVYDNFKEVRGSGVTTLTTASFTIGSGTNRAALLGIVHSDVGGGTITSTCGGVTGALVTNADCTTNHRAVLHRVIAPASGTQTGSMSWPTAKNASLGVMTVSGVNQTTPTQNGTTASGNSASPSITVATAVGDLTMAVCMTSDTLASPTQTNLWIDTTITGGGGSRGPGTGTSDVHAWSQSSNLWGAAGCSLKAVAGGGGGAPGSETITNTATTTWTAPGNIAANTVTVEAWGAGGAGGNNNGTRGAAGGGGGAYARNTVTVVSGNVYPIVVGAGGAATSNGIGGNGANSSFNNNTAGNTAMMVRGAFGTGGSHTSTGPGAGGTVANSIGSTSFAGGSSTGSNVVAGSGSGGGGGGGTTGAGGAPGGTANRTGGAGGTAEGAAPPGVGSGGNAGATTVAGNTGIVPGGGGGGSGNGGTTKVAGPGANGQIRITWTTVGVPVMTTEAADAIASTTATGHGTISNTGDNATGLENCDARGIVYSTSTHADPGNVAPASTAYEGNVQETGGSFAAAAFTESLTSLTASTQYWCRSWAHSRAGYAYGDEETFTTSVAITDTPLTPTVGALTLAGVAPALLTDTRPTPAAGALALAGVTPVTRTETFLTGSVGSLTVAGVAPSSVVGTITTPAAAALTMAGVTPSTLTQTFTTPGAGAVVLQGQAGTLQASDLVTLQPPAGTLTLAGVAPAPLIDVRPTPAAGALVLSGVAAVPLTDTRTTAGVGALVLSGVTPVTVVGVMVAPPAGTLVLTGETASVVQAGPGNTPLAPGAGALVLQGVAGTVQATDLVEVQPPTGALTLTGVAGSVDLAALVEVEPSTGTLTLTGAAGTLQVSEFIQVEPSAGALTLAGAAGMIEVTESVELTPPAGALTLTGETPTLTEEGSFTLQPPAGDLTLTGETPTLESTEPPPVVTGLDLWGEWVPVKKLQRKRKLRVVNTVIGPPTAALGIVGHVGTVQRTTNLLSADTIEAMWLLGIGEEALV